MSNSAPIVEAEKLTKRYGSLTALDSLDLVVPAGQTMALLGPNGAGKSTATELFLGLIAPTKGTIRVQGKSPQDAIRQGAVGAMLQNGALLPDATVSDLLRTLHGLHRRPLKLGEVIARADLSEFLRLSTNRLSGGQAQRVRFAMAIMGDPQLLLLDEPTVGMDVEARRKFWDSMDDLTRDGRTIIFTTHYLPEADSFAERIVVLAGGRVVADGSGPEIKASVGGRLVTFQGPDLDWSRLPGVLAVGRDLDRHQLRSSDSDATLRELLTHPDVNAVEVSSPSLEDAFVQIVS